MNADCKDFKYKELIELLSADIGENLPAVWQAGLRPDLYNWINQ